LKKALKKLTNVKKLKEKAVKKKKGKFNRSIGKNFIQFRARMSSSVDRSRRCARVRIPHTRMRT